MGAGLGSSGARLPGREKRAFGGPNIHTHCVLEVRAFGFAHCGWELESIRGKTDRYSAPTCFIRIVIGVLCRLEG
jgi:hypothetical protein